MRNSKYVVVMFRITIANSSLESLELDSKTSTPEPAFSIKVMKLDLLILTEEFVVDLGSCLC